MVRHHAGCWFRQPGNRQLAQFLPKTSGYTLRSAAVFPQAEEIGVIVAGKNRRHHMTPWCDLFLHLGISGAFTGFHPSLLSFLGSAFQACLGCCKPGAAATPPGGPAAVTSHQLWGPLGTCMAACKSLGIMGHHGVPFLRGKNISVGLSSELLELEMIRVRFSEDIRGHKRI